MNKLRTGLLVLFALTVSCSDGETPAEPIGATADDYSVAGDTMSAGRDTTAGLDTVPGVDTVAGVDTVVGVDTAAVVDTVVGVDTTAGVDSDSGTGGGEQGTAGTLPAGDCLQVADGGQLQAALSVAVAGSCIQLLPGSYSLPQPATLMYAERERQVLFYSRGAGTASQPITIESADENNKAVLSGGGTDGSVYVLWINGPHYVVRNLVLQNGGKGLVLDEASNTLVDGVEVRNMGDEGIHLRSGTSDTMVRNCRVENTGQVQPGFGEGIYIGSDNSQWDIYASTCDHNVVSNCTIVGTAAEPVDIKEGTSGNEVMGCEIHGDGVAGVNWADSFIDLKGVGARVHDNLFYRDGNSTVTRGVAVVERPVGPTASDNWIWDNTFYLDGADGVMVHAYAGTDNYAWNNSRIPDGDDYQGNSPELFLIDPR